MNVQIKLVDFSRVIPWHHEASQRVIEKLGVRFLDPEDYAVSLFTSRPGTASPELAAKVIYANLSNLDVEYLLDQASKCHVEEKVKGLLERVKEAL